MLRLSFCILHSAFCISLNGCGKPNQANLQLRQKNELLHQQFESLQKQHQLDVRLIQKYEQERGSLPTLPEDRLEKLFIARSLKFGRLTGGSDLSQPGLGDHGIKVQIVPLDAQGDPIKTAGSFEIQLFDLAVGKDALIGDWHFDLQQSRQSWFGGFLDSYILTCPWQQIPAHMQLTIRVTFFDELTQTHLPPVEKAVKITLPSPTTAPTSRP